MNVSLTPALKFVQNKVASRLYNSVSEVVHEAIRLLISKETISQELINMLNRDIEMGLEDIQNGNYKNEYEVIKDLIAKYE